MTTWLNIVAVAGGGAIGSVCRYLLTLLAALIPGGSTLWGTIAANVLGCALIGGFASYVDIRNLGQDIFPHRLQLAIQVGFLGGLTTYSTFAAEKAMLVGSGRMGLASAYIAANVLLGWFVLVLAAEGVKTWMD
jgi:CrcB protein